MTRRFDEFYRVKRRDNLGDPDYWNRRFEDIDRRLASTEDGLANIDEVSVRVEGIALDRLNNAITPLVQETQQRLRSISNLFRADSVSSVTLGTGEKTFIVLENQRNTFAALDYVAVRSFLEQDKGMVGRVISFNRDTGELVMFADQFTGTGTFHEWNIAISSPPDLVHAALQTNPHGVTAEQVGAYTKGASDGLISALRTALLGGVAGARDTLKKLSDAIDALNSATATALSGKAAAGHDHDTRYYTKQEVESLNSVGRTHGQCRLAYISATQVRLVGHNGQSLIVNGILQTIPSAGVNLSNAGRTANTLYYVYAYMSGANMTLEASTSVPVQHSNGVTIKTGDQTRTLVGMVRMNASTQFADAPKQRFVRSWFNDPGLQLSAQYTAGRTTTSATPVELNAEIRVEFITWAGERVDLRYTGYGSNSSAGSDCLVSLGIDSTTVFAPLGETIWDQVTANYKTTIAGGTPQEFSQGYHYTTLLASVSGGTLTLNQLCAVHGYAGPR